MRHLHTVVEDISRNHGDAQAPAAHHGGLRFRLLHPAPHCRSRDGLFLRIAAGACRRLQRPCIAMALWERPQPPQRTHGSTHAPATEAQVDRVISVVRCSRALRLCPPPLLAPVLSCTQSLIKMMRARCREIWCAVQWETTCAATAR